MDKRDIEPHVKVFDKSERTDGTFSRSDFTSNAENNLYVCPNGKELLAHLERILELDRLRLRGPNEAKDEFLLAATARNLRKLAKLVPSEEIAFAA